MLCRQSASNWKNTLQLADHEVTVVGLTLAQSNRDHSYIVWCELFTQGSTLLL